MPVYQYFCQECEKKFELEATVQEKEKGLEVTCPHCGSTKIVQVFGSFFTFSKRGGTGESGGCCSTPNPGCCG